MADVNIKVDAAKLRSLAESVSKAQKSLKESCSQAQGQIDSLKNIWTGEAATTYQTSFKKIIATCNEQLLIMEKMASSLYDSADQYAKSVKAVENAAKNIPKLPNDLFK